MELELYTCERILGPERSAYKTYMVANAIREYIDLNYYKDIDGKEIERLFSFQYDYVNRMFKKHIGQSIIQYRNSKRIDAARFLLMTSNKEIDIVARECGFSDPYYFVKYFKKRNGCTPMQYRNKENTRVLF